MEEFITNLSSLFGMKVKPFNFTATIQKAPDPVVADLAARNYDILNIIDHHPQWEEVAQPLIFTWAEVFDGSFPPVDPATPEPWPTWDENGSTMEQYNDAVHRKRASVEWYEENFQYSTATMCSESLVVYDIVTGGLPSYREKELNHSPNAAFLNVVPDGTAMVGAGICPLYGCADFTIPIGQVPYYSQVTHRVEMLPVTVDMAVKRGCDFVLYDVVEKLAETGMLKLVKTGRTAF